MYMFGKSWTINISFDLMGYFVIFFPKSNFDKKMESTHAWDLAAKC